LANTVELVWGPLSGLCHTDWESGFSDWATSK